MPYFDVRSWWKMVRLVRTEPDPKRRAGLYRTLLGLVPLAALVHAVCFLLDPIFYPALRRTEVRAPVFGVGHARSGTTLLHRLMASDRERFSTFRLYEMFFPSLLEKKAIRWLGRVDARWLGGRIRARVDRWDERKFRRTQGVHEMSVWADEEDDFVLAFTCCSGFWMVLLPYMDCLDFYHVDRWPPRKRRRLMAYYKECIRRQLYLNGPGKTHLSKNAGFCGRTEALIETFPDARFVLPVRNPYETIPSLLKLMQTSWTLRKRDHSHIQRSLRVLAEISYHTYTHPLEVLGAHPEVTRSIVDYRDLVADPKAAVEKVYADLGLPMTRSFAAVLDREQGRPYRSTHRYSLDEYGLTRDEIHTRLAAVFERFGWDAGE
jgi:hypothetical protein